MKERLKGKILIANPNLEDPNFNGTVILIAEHDSNGAIGFILNRKIGKLDKSGFYISEGGPVDTNTFWGLSQNEQCDFLKIRNGLYYGKINSNPEENEDFLTDDEMIFFIGCSGWTKNQLEDEINTGTWIVDNANVKNIFSKKGVKMWIEEISKNKPEFKWTESLAEDPSKN